VTIAANAFEITNALGRIAGRNTMHCRCKSQTPVVHTACVLNGKRRTHANITLTRISGRQTRLQRLAHESQSLANTKISRQDDRPAVSLPRRCSHSAPGARSLRSLVRTARYRHASRRLPVFVCAINFKQRNAREQKWLWTIPSANTSACCRASSDIVLPSPNNNYNNKSFIIN
jgi:hypothetical protein